MTKVRGRKSENGSHEASDCPVRTFPLRPLTPALAGFIYQAVEKRHERRQDKAKVGEKAQFMFDK